MRSFNHALVTGSFVVSLLSTTSVSTVQSAPRHAPRCAFVGVASPAAAASTPSSSASTAAPSARRIYSTPTVLRNNKNSDEMRDRIERTARERAYENRSKGGGVGETAAGAILGGVLGGPFGALFGAQIGSAFGSAKVLSDARVTEMNRKGITPDMLEMATNVGQTLDNAMEGLLATRESVATSRSLAKKLDELSTSLYDRAAKAIAASGEEEAARNYLLERERVKEKLLKVLQGLAEEQKRLVAMEGNVEALETRALEVESLLRRSVGAATTSAAAEAAMNGEVGAMGYSLEPEDPLLQKFRDLEK